MAVETSGGLDVLMNDAGIVSWGPIDDLTHEQWDTIIAVALGLGRHGVRCSSIHPGVIRSAMTAGFPDAPEHVALHRTGEPEEVSRLVVLLDGGETAGRATRPE